MLGGCAGAPLAPAGGVDAFPEGWYAAPPVEGRVFRLDAAHSRLEVMVFRDGPMARMGHNHLLLATDFRGAVLLGDELADSRVDIALAVADLDVDPSAARKRAGAAFAAPVDDDAREGTRANLLGARVLDAAAHPLVHASATVAAGELPWLLLRLRLAVRGHVHEVTVPVQVTLDDGRLQAQGMLALEHAALGLEPFRALGGLLAVADPILLRFELVGEPAP